MTIQDNMGKPGIYYRLLGEYRGSLIKFIDLTTDHCFILRADKIISNHNLFSGFNQQDAESIYHCAKNLLPRSPSIVEIMEKGT